jgi:hypothetical protein
MNRFQTMLSDFNVRRYVVGMFAFMVHYNKTPNDYYESADYMPMRNGMTAPLALLIVWTLAAVGLGRKCSKFHKMSFNAF